MKKFFQKLISLFRQRNDVRLKFVYFYREDGFIMAIDSNLVIWYYDTKQQTWYMRWGNKVSLDNPYSVINPYTKRSGK